MNDDLFQLQKTNRKQKQISQNRRSLLRSFLGVAHQLLLDLQMGANAPGNEPNRQGDHAHIESRRNFNPDLHHLRVVPVNQTDASIFFRTKYSAFFVSSFCSS